MRSQSHLQKIVEEYSYFYVTSRKGELPNYLCKPWAVSCELGYQVKLLSWKRGSSEVTPWSSTASSAMQKGAHAQQAGKQLKKLSICALRGRELKELKKKIGNYAHYGFLKQRYFGKISTLNHHVISGIKSKPSSFSLDSLRLTKLPRK